VVSASTDAVIAHQFFRFGLKAGHHVRARFVAIIFVIVVAAAIAAWLFRSSWPRQSESRSPEWAQQPSLQTDLTVKQIMTALVDRQADVLWGSVGTIVTKAGTEELAPRTDAEWSLLAEQAARLGEAAKRLETHAHPPNPLSGPPGWPGVHAASSVVDPREWISLAQGLGGAASVAARAVRAKDPVALFDAGETLAESCDACHKRFWDDVSASTGR
jgi:hypothetical protein